jgi:hypothetical protein
MRRIFGTLMIIGIAIGSQAQGIGNDELAYVKTAMGDPNSSTGIEIYPTVVNNELNIEIDDRLADGKVTVSIFNSVGEIVMEETLDTGLNKLNVAKLAKGNYVAVVRENDVYKSKSNFEVI